MLQVRKVQANGRGSEKLRCNTEEAHENKDCGKAFQGYCTWKCYHTTGGGGEANVFLFTRFVPILLSITG